CNPSPSQGDSAGKEWVTEFSSPHQGRSDTRVADREQFRKKGQTSRTVTLGAQSVPFNLENEDSASATDLCSLEGPDLPHSQPNDSSIDLDGSALDPIQKDKLGSLLEDFRGLFAAHLGHTTVAVHHIDTGDARPINLPPYRTSPLKKKLIEEQIQSMLEDGIIEPASGPWSAPVVIVPKPSGEARFCVDYRGLNQVTVKDRYPLPRVDESLDFLARGKFISTLDMARGYWQVGVEKGSRAKTVFVSHCGLFQFRVLPFGLCNAPPTFQRVMNTVLAGLIYKCCAVYLDDIVIASPTFEQHLLDLREVFLRLEKAGLTLKPGKCQFCRKELKFLGYKVSPDGILPDSDKIDAVLKFPVPTDVKQPGLKNTVPDALSRNPQQGSIGPTDVLPRYAIIASLGLASQSLAELVDKEQLRGLQREDPVVAEILKKLEDPQDTHSVEEWEDKFVTCDGLVYYRDTERSCSLHPLSDSKLFVPESLRGLLLKYYHDHPTAGHLGFMHFFWPKMRKDVKSYVLSCPVCQLTKPSQLKPAGMLVPVHATEPWEIVGVDFVGPLPRTQAGNAYLLVFVDYFSKWVEVSAVREATAQIAASRFQSDIFARHGAPRFLISDRGQQFMSAFFNHVVEALGTEHRFTTAYHPQTNAAERVNRTLKAAIRAYGTVHTIRPLGLDDPLMSQPETPENAVQRIHDHARASQKSSHVRQKRHYDKTRRTVVYEPGDLVRLKSHPRLDAVANLTAKLAPVFSGPYKVVKKLSDVNYRLSGVDGTDMGVVHVVNLQPFRVRSTPHTESQSYLTSGTATSQDSSSSRVVDSLSPTSCEKPEFEIGEQAAVEGTHVSDRPVYSNSGQITLSQPLADMFVEERDTPLTHSYDLRSRVGCSDRLDTHTNLRLGHDIDNATDDLSQVSAPGFGFSFTHYNLRPRRRL
ncbi:hypothetical protein NFI96_026358, partial [Prochilodus magdalenae]